MTMNQYGGNPIEQRKAEVRKYSNTGRIALGAGVVSLVLGVIASNAFLYAVLPIVALVTVGFCVWKVRGIVNHKDQW